MHTAITGAALALTGLLGGVGAVEPVAIKAHEGWVGGVAFAPDGKTLASVGGDGALKLWDPASGTRRQTWAAHKGRVTAVAWSPDGKTIATAGFDHTVRLWDVKDVKDPATPRVLKGHDGVVMSVAFSPDSKQLVSGGLDGTVYLWDVATGNKVLVFKKHTSWVNSVAFGTDGKDYKILSGSSDRMAHGWKGRDEHWGPWVQVKAREGEVRSAALAPDGETLAVGVRYGTARVWHARTPPRQFPPLTGMPGDVWAVAFSPDGKTLACGAGDWDRPGEVRLFNLEREEWKPRMTLRHSGEVLCVAFSRDGRWLAAGAWDGAVRIWDMKKLPAAGK